MLTFDSALAFPLTGELELDVLKEAPQPTTVEIGETNDLWLAVNRITRLIELRSKQTGSVVATCTVMYAIDYGLNWAQIEAAKAVLGPEPPKEEDK